MSKLSLGTTVAKSLWNERLGLPREDLEEVPIEMLKQA